jgi:hypothetical protein
MAHEIFGLELFVSTEVGESRHDGRLDEVTVDTVADDADCPNTSKSLGNRRQPAKVMATV